ncbi:MAG: acyltransferase family protein [Olegusella sp.]|nr:acyltransferase family protein [Olegusella sp.]
MPAGGDQVRLRWIDLARGLAIVLVALGHLTTGNGTSVWFPALDDLHTGLYLFHMPLFFILGGLVLNVRGRDFRGFASRRARTLLVPYYVFSLYYLAKPLMLTAHPELAATFGAATSDVGQTAWDVLVMGEGLWFLWAYFWGQLFAFGVLRALEDASDQVRINVCQLLGFALTVAVQLWWVVGPALKLPFHLVRGVEAAGYILIGVALRDVFAKAERPQAALTGLGFAVAFAFVARTVLPDTLISRDFVCVVNGTPAPVSAGLTVVVAYLGASAVILIARAIETCPPLEYVGRDSIVYYALSAPAMNLCKLVLFSLLGVDVAAAVLPVQLAAGCSLALVSIALIVPVDLLIQRHLPWLIGRRRTDAGPRAQTPVDPVAPAP